MHLELPALLGAILAPPDSPSPQSVGELELAPHQARAVATIVDRVELFGGVLLADAVGLGKTRVALAAAKTLLSNRRRDGRHGPIWLIVPARLKRTWRERATRAGLRKEQFELVSHSAMSRGTLPARQPALVVVDEAHRFRNPSTHRYRALSRVATEAPLILASATPVANHTGDLLALFRLFLGDSDLRPWLGVDIESAFERGGASLLRLLEELVVRRTHWDAGDLTRPRARLELLPYDPEPAEAWVWQNLGDQLAQLDLTLLQGDWPRGLFIEHSLRLWESGPRALAASLQKLIDFHRRWLEAERHGATISRLGFRELFGHKPDQSVFAFMFDEVASDAPPPASRERVTHELRALEHLYERVDRAAKDVSRERALVDLIAEVEGKTLVFTSFRRAARSTFDALVHAFGAEARVGLVTGDAAVATGLGRVPADEVLRRFSPGSFGIVLPAHQAIDVLVATDCIAEGIDLNDCGRIVLSDLPYSPLKIEQRIGRLLRPGSPHEEVVVHLPRPRNWNDTLGMRRRLSTKLGEAERASLPYTNLGLGPSDTEGSEPTISPLSTLTRRDAWRRALPRDGMELPDQNYWRVPGRREESIWLFARVEDGSRIEDVVIRATAEGVDDDWSELLRHIDELASFQPVAHAVGRFEHPLLDEAMSRLDRRLELLNAARLAPFPVALDSAAHRAFRAITTWADENGEPLDRDGLRDRLLRPWPRGVERRIESWIDAPWRGARAWGSLPSHPALQRLTSGRIQVVHLVTDPSLTRSPSRSS